jgi:hypothetical protein
LCFVISCRCAGFRAMKDSASFIRLVEWRDRKSIVTLCTITINSLALRARMSEGRE